MENSFVKTEIPVKFIDTRESYPTSANIECKFNLEGYHIQDGDRIAIFKVGWESLKHYVLFEWVLNSGKSDINSVTFSRYDLPTASDDFYQFCYISGENIIVGVSQPFQIYSPDSIRKSSILMTDNEKVGNLKQLLSDKDEEIAKLKQENVILKESLKALIHQKSQSNYESEIYKLTEVMEKLRTTVLAHQREIDTLKIEIKKDRAYNKNLLLEKKIAEKKFEAICQKEAKEIKPTTYDFDLEGLQSIPPFHTEIFDK